MAATTLTRPAPPTAAVPAAGPARPAPPAWRTRAATVFTADLRSLAAFRIALASVILVDLGGRALNLSAHYTDAGVLPRSALLGQRGLLEGWTLSVNVIDGGLTFQAAVFVAAGLAALALLAGWYTRLATIVLWVLVVSIEWRNPLVMGAGEILLRLLLFWAMFLPLDAWWSLDARRRDGPAPAVRLLSVPTAALFLQIAFVYWFAVILKSGPEWRFDGTAIYYALGVDQLATPLGHFLWGFPNLLRPLTFGVLAIEAFAPFLLLSPVFNARARVIGVALIVSLHVGIWSTMGMGIFPFVAAGCMVCFLPGEFWDRWAARRRRPAPADGPRLRTPQAVNVVAGIALAYVLAWNITTVTDLSLPTAAARAGRIIGLSQIWDMFAPSPLRDDGWYVVAGTLSDGRRVDVAGVLRGDQSLRRISWRRPDSIRATYRSERWRKYLEEVRNRFPGLTPNLGRYICRSWNEHHAQGAKLVQYQMTFMGDPTLPHNRIGKPQLRILWVDNCAA